MMPTAEPPSQALPGDSIPLTVPDDLTGRSRFGRNVAFAWGGHLVHVIAGFVMPRLISDRLGQTTLGIWDFSWSLVAYFGLVQLGLGASVNRYVARYRARGDTKGLSKSVSTIGLSLKIAGCLAAVLAVITAWWILPLFAHRLNGQVTAGGFVVLFLGIEIAIGLSYTVYGGLIVGCHRWDIQNTLTTICYAVTALAMIGALMLGGGLPSIAFVHLIVSAGTDFARSRIARRVCPELVVNFRRASWKIFLEQARFSAKSVIPRIATLISNQSLSILIATSMGPAALAIYSRPRNLIQQIQTFAAKFGYILIPAASSMQAKSDHQSLRSTFMQSTFCLSSLFMPVLFALAIFGDEVIRFWMGDHYVYKGLMAVLAIGCFPGWVQEPIWSILAGTNRHGRVAIARLTGAICSAILVAIALLVFKRNLLAAAIGFVIPQAFVDGVVTPRLACQRLGACLRRYYWESMLKPFLWGAPYAVCLLLARWTMRESAWYPITFICVGVFSLGASYWRFIVPVSFKRKIAGWFQPVCAS